MTHDFSPAFENQFVELIANKGGYRQLEKSREPGIFSFVFNIFVHLSFNWSVGVVKTFEDFHFLLAKIYEALTG